MGAGWIGAFIASVTVYLWICFALCGEGAEVYAVILADVVPSARNTQTACSWS